MLQYLPEFIPMASRKKKYYLERWKCEIFMARVFPGRVTRTKKCALSENIDQQSLLQVPFVLPPKFFVTLDSLPLFRVPRVIGRECDGRYTPSGCKKGAMLKRNACIWINIATSKGSMVLHSRSKIHQGLYTCATDVLRPITWVVC